jgi:outer membrane protein OmpA-like peptidoglycan-associated protein
MVLGAVALGLAPEVAGAMEIRLALMGQAGIEDPKFEVLVNDTVVGSGTVELSAKSSEGERLTGDTVFDPYVQRFVFETELAEGTSAQIGVRFLNDYYDADKGIDANLYVMSVSVDGKELDLSGVEVLGAEEQPRDVVFWRGVLVLPWYATANLAYSVDAGTTTEQAASAAVVEPSVSPTPPEDTAAESAANEAAPVEEVAAAPAEPTPPAEPAPPVCTAVGSLVISYPNGESALLAEGRSALDALVSKGLAGCAIDIAGYSSLGGPVDINLAVSQARAAEVEAYLRTNGPEGLSMTAEGKGATNEFGAGAENRRVVVTIE